MSCKIVNARSIADLVGHAIDDIQLQNYKTLFQMNLIEDRKKLKENLTTLKEENIISYGFNLVIYQLFSIVSSET